MKNDELLDRLAAIHERLSVRRDAVEAACLAVTADFLNQADEHALLYGARCHLEEIEAELTALDRLVYQAKTGADDE